ncbi:anaphase-promoting complex subunit CDC26 isoform X1 [Amblyraja radiata]|uniref:anaphase-promoting complex subunit CDC26-like isoform X1 n=1 Tax=Amblyraja radiata TaxID=386614 RepID=UPI001402D639|nr:anaphase-promoting complex subunit CDC26-like isoform X1 [Amblyraja radiata]XP_032904741.1 anaphase-promoting complex subunit CDC26 isoform X1 [Amblyraja radiata]XP_055516357.1 anaphase-promoting complex subunit CDC26 isoform X1 [Leucoraja erinacea]
MRTTGRAWPSGAMLRRKPTRLELKLDDIEEFESMKKELEQNQKKQQQEEGEMVSSSDVESANGARDEAKVREKINERIGYRPNSHINKHFSLFGNLH